MKLLFVLRISFFLLVSLAVISSAQTNDKVSQKLSNEIQERGENATYRAWIFFTDKGTGIESKLMHAEENLTPRALKRRLRNRGAENLVDFKDIPVNPNYIRQINSRVQKIHHKSRWLNAVSVETSGRDIRRLESLVFVKKIDIVRVGKMPHPQPESIPPSISNQPMQETQLNYGPSYDQNNQINTIPLHNMGYDGSGVLVCMLDAGFNNLQHEALTHLNILHTWDFVNGDSVVSDEPGQAGTGNHGTYTLSTLAGFKEGELVGPAYGADFILAKTENTDWEHNVEEDDWVAGAEWADSLGADVISSSLSYLDFDPGQISYTWQDMDGNTAVSTIGADIAASRGIFVANSAGNNGSAIPPQNTLGAPADGDSVAAIGAVNSSGSRASFSSMGPTSDGRIKPDLMARGVSTVCASPFNPTGYSGVSGTSLSCPLVAGASALVQQVNPYYTNIKILNALRKTANNSNTPNNSYGWGIIDAFTAAFYYTPRVIHTPLSDTENEIGPYTAQVEITTNFTLIPDSVLLIYHVNHGAFQTVQMTNQGGNFYEGSIPGPGDTATIGYYFRAVSDSGFANLPAHAPSDLFQFKIGTDTIPPIIVHNPIQWAAYGQWPVDVRASITDNSGVDDNQVFVEWMLNSTPQADFNLQRIQNDLFEGTFNLDSSQVNDGDIVEYRIIATDLASNPNIAYHPEQGFHQFEIVQTRGVILLLDDESTAQTTIEDRGKTIEYHQRGVKSSTAQIQDYLQDLNFLVTVESASQSDTSAWNQYNLLISASGENPSPVADANYRQHLIEYVQNGGKLLIEGGEVGYDALSNPSYPNFASQVLHGTTWNGDYEGPLKLLISQQNHPIAIMPNQLPNSISLDYNSSSGYYDQDAITPDFQSYIVYECQDAPGDAGILVYDNNPFPESAQIVFYPFDFSSIIDTTAAKYLLENTLVFLLADEGVVGIDDKETEIAYNFDLYPAYPNPFNPTTTIRFTLPAAEDVNLAVYNNLGQKVATLIEGYQQAGEHRLTWDAARYASGVYYLMLKASEGQKIQKLLLIK